MAQAFGSQLALIAFAAAVVQGLIGGASAEAALARALWSGALFFGVGTLLGELARQLVEEVARRSQPTKEAAPK